MAYTLRAHSASFFNPWGATQSVPIATSVAGDCIVLVICLSSSTLVTVSGAGATWVRNTESSGPTLLVFVGYGCTAGATSISVTGGTGSQVGDYVIGQFSGVLATANPIRGSVAVGTTTGLTVTTGSLTYVAGDLLIGTGGFGQIGTWTLPSVWSNAGTDNTIGDSAGTRGAVGTYQISASGSATTYEPTISGVSNNISAIALALKPAPPSAQGNMLLPMEAMM